jgi:hypothetical protein
VSAIVGHYTISAPVAPTDTLDKYATHRAKWGHGGLRTVTEYAELLEITEDRREAGMLACVYPSAGTPEYYMLREDLVTWQLVMRPGLEYQDAKIVEETLAFAPWSADQQRAVATVDLEGKPADASLYVDSIKVASGLIRNTAIPGHRFEFYMGLQVSFVEARAVIVKRG